MKNYFNTINNYDGRFLTDKFENSSLKGILEDTNDLLNAISDGADIISNYAKGKNRILITDLLLGALNTLKSIQACCKIGSFSDSNILTRKFRDDLFLYLFILEADNNKYEIINERVKEAGVLDCDLFSDGIINQEKMTEWLNYYLQIHYSEGWKDIDHKAIDAWFDDSAHSGDFRRQLDNKNYYGYLEKNQLVKQCIDIFKLKSSWDMLKKRENNYTHNNGRTYISDNIPFHLVALNQRLEELLDQIGRDIIFITSLFLTILILIKPNFISSSDYLDYLEIGEQPPEDSQYWVDPTVQDFISKYLSSLHPELSNFLKKNNPYGMMID